MLKQRTNRSTGMGKLTYFKSKTMTNRERLNEMYNTYGLSTEDIFQSPQGWKIITRSGIDRIQAKADVVIKYDLLVSDVPNKTYVVKATATLGEKYIETFGETSPDNTRQKYPIAMAEKRAMSRAVLKLTGFYELGVMGEDEADDFGTEAKKHRNSLTTKTL